MRLDQIRERESAKQKGATWKTLIMVVWLGIGFVAAYFISGWLAAHRWVTADMFYGIGLPDAVPAWVIRGGIMLLIVTILQVFLFLGFALADPAGRRRSGMPSMHSYNKVLDDDRSGR